MPRLVSSTSSLYDTAVWPPAALLVRLDALTDAAPPPSNSALARALSRLAQASSTRRRARRRQVDPSLIVAGTDMRCIRPADPQAICPNARAADAKGRADIVDLGILTCTAEVQARVLLDSWACGALVSLHEITGFIDGNVHAGQGGGRNERPSPVAPD